MNRFRRGLSAILAALLFVTCFPIITFANDQFAIICYGDTVSQVEFYKNEKLEVSVENVPAECSTQWQIQIPDTDFWVDIQGQTDLSIKLSYAVLGSLLKENSAWVRCVAKSDGQEKAWTEPLCATILEPVEIPTEEPATEPAEVPTEEPATEPVEEPTEEPATEPVEEPTEEPATEPAEVPTEVPETEPVEEPTEEPATEPAEVPTEESATEPAEVPTEVPETEPIEIIAEDSQPVLFASSDSQPEAMPVAEEEATTSSEETTELVNEGITDFVSITVQYVYRDDQGNPVEGFDWPPFVANIPSGIDYSTEVQIKSIPGYTARLETVEGLEENESVTLSDDCRTVSIVLKNVTEPMVFTVIYQTIEVPYYVRRFLQNVNNDLYTEDTTFINEEYKGYPGALPDTSQIYKEGEYPGFTPLFYQPDSVAADGSTVFEVYYDRNYYLINVDLQGGHGAQPVYARYETAYRIAQPEKPGFTFDGWKLVEGGTEDRPNGTVLTELTGTIPDRNQKYQAQWTKGDTSFIVIYWLEDANSDKYVFHSSSASITAQTGDEITAADYKNGVEFNDLAEFVTYNEEKTLEEEAKREDLSESGKVIVRGDGTTVLNVYYDRKKYNLKFYYAMTEETTDLVTYPSGHKYIYVIGGSTWSFGANATVTDKSNELNMLNWYMSNGTGRGTITALPELTEAGAAKGYTMGTVRQTVGTIDFIYYYLMFSAKYGQNIGDMWPIDVFKPVTRADMSNQNHWDSDQAYASAWNGEYNVYYSRFKNNGNQTIKGKYQKLDYRILWADVNEKPFDPDDMTVSYMCFWENGTNINWSVPELYYYRLWIPLLENEVTDAETKEYNGVTYKLYERYATCDNSEPDQQTAITLEGYDKTAPVRVSVGGAITSTGATQAKNILSGYGYTDAMFATYREWYVVDYYYTRNPNKRLYYYNVNSHMQDGNGASVPYGKSLGIYGSYFSKEVMERDYYPSVLEKNAYEFDDWYISPECVDGSQMNWNGTMPDADITVYAKWLPKTYDVYFYLDYEQYQAKTPVYHWAKDCEHGKTMLNPPAIPQHGDPNYTFVRWVYEDEAGTKHSFDPTQMPVRQDMELYAEWRTAEIGEYTVYYAKGVEQADGTITMDLDENNKPIYLTKEPDTGYAIVGTTKTVQARPLSELDNIPATMANQLWLPETSSHSILMQSQNTYTFLYITKEDAQYTVKYLDTETNESLIPDTTGSTKNAEETIWAKNVESYVPDLLYKRLILSADNDKNVLIFYYTKVEPDEALYQVNHLVQTADGKGFTSYKIETGTMTIGQTATATPLTISGFTYTADAFTIDGATYRSQTSGTVTSGADDGANKALELKLYYLRNRADYTVYYKNQEDDSQLQNPKTVQDVYVGSVVEETAPTIPGYDLISNGTQTLTISGTASLNELTFWYRPKEHVVNYMAICSDPCAENFGTLERSQDMGTQINGSTAYALDGFYFDGWYQEDESGKLILVEKNAKFNPKESKLITDDVFEYTFKARFVPITLTISQTGMAEQNRSAIYEIVNAGGTVIARVSITGDSSVTLTQIPVGNYTIREITADWTWTYANSNPKSFTVAAGTNEVKFQHTYKDVHWYNSENYGIYDWRRDEEDV